MAQTAEGELVDRFEAFYRNYYRDAIAQLAQNYPSEQRSLSIDWSDLYQFDADIADDYISKPEQLREYAEEALRLYDLPVDVSLGQAHVRIRNLPDVTEIRAIRSPDVNTLVAVSGIIRKATDVRPKIEEAAFECQRCGTLSYIPQSGGFQEPHECNGCERQGPFSVNYDQSTFVDAQKIRVQERPEGLRGGETPQSIDVDLEDDITGEVAPGDYVTVTGVLRIDQQEDQSGKSRMFDVFMDGHSLVLEDEEFEEMDISEADKRAIVELSQEADVYDRVIESIAPSIYGYEEEKLASRCSYSRASRRTSPTTPGYGEIFTFF
jgi:replicative DNA helicase Mcm